MDSQQENRESEPSDRGSVDQAELDVEALIGRLLQVARMAERIEDRIDALKRRVARWRTPVPDCLLSR